MKIEKQVKLIPTLDSDEISCIRRTVKILTEIEELMENHECDTYSCYGEYTYNIEDLRSMATDLENFVEIDEIFA